VLALSKLDVRLFENEDSLVECDAIFTVTLQCCFKGSYCLLCSEPVNPKIVVKLLESEDESANTLRNVVKYLTEVFGVLEYWAAYSVTDVSGQPTDLLGSSYCSALFGI
jgi:hypothetical protein